ncbi:MAG: hypothetical protein COU64_06165 [Candidatus Pacebacteria bacterium CG10_big_fil_rev_8_21_14_0_10_40_26]|uniref:Uncharacterized protein n=1 Tax=Candidatus Roizmanbacteria bacterium CG_4_10_14_0_2_um_filter_39_13 TaxID=1974825 RepID=A0A2M7U202_9BACT|nr:MAG: hypothetical protein COU64_06165 [Candidatus Pacebacteria bacterium CG10_big_fil_rev_8_21_14_0_10_40_26]PIZ64136.1 MAG: hypothetical protein COY16_00025 [Candidatus Roizmanbacteria bacterium CG_4_10_14_0_2_um_filter_39_13]
MEAVLDLISKIVPVGIIGLVIKAYIDHGLQESSEIKIRIRESKENQYKSLLTNLMGFFVGWEDYEIKDKTKRKKQFLWEVYTSVPVYASDEVIKLCYKFIASHSRDRATNDNSDKIYAKLVLAIRKELNKIYGQPDTNLIEKDIKVLKVDF